MCALPDSDSCVCVCMCVCVLLRYACFNKKHNRETLIKQLDQDVVALTARLRSQKEETTKKLLAFRQEVRHPLPHPCIVVGAHGAARCLPLSGLFSCLTLCNGQALLIPCSRVNVNRFFSWYISISTLPYAVRSWFVCGLYVW